MSMDAGNGSLSDVIDYNLAGITWWSHVVGSNSVSFAGQSGVIVYEAFNKADLIGAAAVAYGRNAGFQTNAASTNFTLGYSFIGPAASDFGQQHDVIGNSQASNFWHRASYRNGATNSTVNTNMTVNFNAGIVDLYLTNNVSFTNFANVPASNYAALAVFRIHVQGVNRTAVWPTLGGPSFGVYCETNTASPLWTTLTNGTRYRLTFDAFGTNIATTLTAWY
jgi:hypothetical protein